ncbi:uncharacterized protein LOC111661319 [Seriola lalandi dorsalis]|uniref:Uncharacterized LOC111661319 n=1 Tax=Seriola lalandi dorsalis TaxID=1841481 RepID=A0A3B4Y1V4_SERLL|nr:uncharacterized protein LOC111661319 [Seriola lalandi dorsalis]XP_056223856.1 interferon gamma-like [Seriola aureovittata]
MVTTARAMVCLTLWFSVCQVRAFHIPPKMNKTIQELMNHYDVSAKLIFSGKPIFSKEALNGKMETKRVFLGGVLEAYEKIIGQMLKELPTPSPQTVTAAPSNNADTRLQGGEDVRVQLSYILKKVQELRKHHYQEQDMFLQRLQALKHIKMDDLIIQNKALFELPFLYAEASSLPDSMKMQMRQRRRRRQARRVKTSQRA